MQRDIGGQQGAMAMLACAAGEGIEPGWRAACPYCSSYSLRLTTRALQRGSLIQGWCSECGTRMMIFTVASRSLALPAPSWAPGIPYYYVLAG